MSSAHLLLLLLLAADLLPFSSAATLSVSPATLTRSNRTARIHWSGVSAPSELDWLGIYSPPDSRDDHFIGYLFLSSAPTWRSGAGALDVPLVNLRSAYAFRIFRWTAGEINNKHHDHDQNPIPGVRHRLAASEEVKFDRPAAPEQLHLSFTDREDEMRVMFVTGDGKKSEVRYGLEEGRLDWSVGTEVTRYERSDMCDAPANSSLGWRDPGFIHDGVMKDLKKGTKYYYKVGSGSVTRIRYASPKNQSPKVE